MERRALDVFDIIAEALPRFLAGVDFAVRVRDMDRGANPGFMRVARQTDGGGQKLMGECICDGIG